MQFQLTAHEKQMRTSLGADAAVLASQSTFPGGSNVNRKGPEHLEEQQELGGFAVPRSDGMSRD